VETRVQPQVLVLGLGRYGLRLARRLQEAGLEVLGVDCDPELARRLAGGEIPVRFGDGQDPDFLDTLPLTGLRWVISTLPDSASNRVLLQGLVQHGYVGEIAVVARDEAQGAELWRAGVPVILYPFRDAVDFAATNIIAVMTREAAGPAPAADR
jgi:Trk K+ transport system NAD-binding subunit